MKKYGNLARSKPDQTYEIAEEIIAVYGNGGNTKGMCSASCGNASCDKSCGTTCGATK